MSDDEDGIHWEAIDQSVGGSKLMQVASVANHGDRTAMKPQRLQQKRVKGWRKPPNSVVVSRPSKWGNPFPIDADHDRAAVVRMYRAWITGPDPRASELREQLKELRGRNLLCFCPVPGPCHADVLLELANR